MKVCKRWFLREFRRLARISKLTRAFPKRSAVYFRSNGTKKFLTIPTIVGSSVNGFIGIRHEDRPPYRPEEIELAQALAHQAMFAIQLNEFAEQGQRAAVLDERNRMARDIHDNLAQGLTGVIVQLQAAEDATSKGYKKAAQSHLENARNLARHGLSEARRSVRALRPQALEDGTFWDAFESLIKMPRSARRSKLSFRFAERCASFLRSHRKTCCISGRRP